MQRRRPYYVDIPLRWSDMDALRHVNNVQIVRLLEEARVLGFAEWFGHDERTSRVPRMLIARTEIEYRRQLHYRHRPVSVAMWVSRIAAASFDVGYEVLSSDEDDAELYSAAETTLVPFDLDTQRPVRVDSCATAVLEKYLDEPAPMRRRRR